MTPKRQRNHYNVKFLKGYGHSISVKNSKLILKACHDPFSSGTVLLEYYLISKFLELLERTFQKERQYDYRHGKKTRNGLKSVQEITIAKIMIQNLAEFCSGKQKEFKI
jgi:hypothetical protein